MKRYLLLSAFAALALASCKKLVGKACYTCTSTVVRSYNGLAGNPTTSSTTMCDQTKASMEAYEQTMSGKHTGYPGGDTIVITTTTTCVADE